MQWNGWACRPNRAKSLGEKPQRVACGNVGVKLTRRWTGLGCGLPESLGPDLACNRPPVTLLWPGGVGVRGKRNEGAARIRRNSSTRQLLRWSEPGREGENLPRSNREPGEWAGVIRGEPGCVRRSRAECGGIDTLGMVPNRLQRTRKNKRRAQAGGSSWNEALTLGLCRLELGLECGEPVTPSLPLTHSPGR